MAFIESIKAALPDYAKDTKLNLDAVLLRSTLDPDVAMGCAVAALASRAHVWCSGAHMHRANLYQGAAAVLKEQAGASGFGVKRNLPLRHRAGSWAFIRR